MIPPNRSPSRLALFAAALAAGVGCVSLDDPARVDPVPRVEATELGGMENAAICGDFVLGGVPTASDLDLARRRGVRRVVSLVPEGHGARGELAAACGELELAYFEVPLASDAPSDEEVDRVLGILGRDADGLTLMCCESGSRTPVLFAIFRVVARDVELEVALEDARRHGMKAGASEEFVRAQVRRIRELTAESEGDGRPPEAGPGTAPAS